MSGYKHLFAIACLGMLLFGIALISLGSILPEMVAKFQVDELAAGTLATILPSGLLISSLLFGPFADRFGFKGLLLLAAFLVMVGLEGIAFAPSWWWVGVATFLIGLGGGALNGATNALMVDISEENSSANVSLLGVFFGIGALGMPALIAALSPTIILEYIIASIGVFVFLVMLYTSLVSFPPAKLETGIPFRQGVRMLKSPVMLLLSFILFCQSGLEGLVNNWTTSYFQEELKVTSGLALLALTTFVAAMTVMRLILGGWLKRVHPYQVLILGIALTLVGAILLNLNLSFVWCLGALVLLGAGFAGVFPIILAHIGDLWADLSGTALSVALVIGVSGNIATNYFTGLLSHHYGITVFPLLLGSIVVLLTLLLLRARRHFPP
jgi:FHS family glucose/mannose:H+ symporter-like MFS transporter